MGIAFTDDVATIGTTEYSLPGDASGPTAQTDDCILQTFLDVSALAAGDEFRIRIYEKVDSGTQRIVDEWTLVGAQARPIWTHPTLIVGDGWDVTVKKISGTDRSISWSLRKIT